MSSRGRAGLSVVALLGAALGLSACFGAPPPPPPPPPPVACQSASAEVATPAPTPPPANGDPIPVGEAGEQAREAVAASDQRTPTGEIPLVTTEETPAGPAITSTAVSGPDQAAAVADAAAADGNLVTVEVDVPVYADAVNDPLLPEQWSFTKVNYEGAWSTTTGSGQTVAVIDTGVHAAHPDLAGKVLPGQFFLHSEDGNATFSGGGGQTDGSGHGTHVAGIIAAAADNATGIAGAAPGVKILPVQVLCADGGGLASDVARGIIWAADNLADVINLSLGSTTFSSTELAAVTYARSKGVVVVAAAGNDQAAGNPASYPGAFPEVIAVGATTNTTDNSLASYSTIGTYLDLAAPGGASGLPSNSARKVLSTWNDGGYASIAGTSMATPHVSAAAALVGAAHPEYTTHQAVCTQLVRTAQDLGQTGLDSSYGYGLIHPELAVAGTVPTGASCT